MQAEVTTRLCDAFLNSFESPFTGSIPDWLHKHVSYPEGSPHPGQFDINICPWLKEVYQSIQDPSIEIVIMEGAAQTYKTGVTENVMCYWAVEAPANMLRISNTKDVAEDFAKVRLLPMLNSCQPVKALMEQQKGKAAVDLIVLPNMAIKIAGPSTNFQHGWTVQRLTIDEAHLLKEPGLFEKLFRRTEQYKGRRKILISSTPGEMEYANTKLIGDELSILVDSGRVFRRAWKCPKCSQYNTWKWSAKRTDGTYSGINWGKEIDAIDGKTDLEKTSDNAKLECHHCRCLLDDSPIVRIQLEQEATYQCIKDNGNKKIVTYQWPAWVAPHNSFKDACIQYLKAKELADAHIYDQLKEFYQQVAGEEWTNKIARVKSKLSFAQFDSTADWIDEKFRFMTVDLQADGRRYYMIVAFDVFGNARLIHYGIATSWAEIEGLAVKYKVQKTTGENAHFVGIDCGYDWSTVAKETVHHGLDLTFDENGHQWKERFGWLCLRGEHKDSFQWEDGIKRVVSPQNWYDAGSENPPARVYYWCNKSVKNLVASIRDGHNKLTLTLNTQDDNLIRQLNSEYPDAQGEWKEKGGANHWWDTLCMSYVLAMLAGIPFFGEDTAVKN